MTRALILAAGQGTRLRPLTNDIPKCMVSLLGKSLLERQVEVLRGNDVSDIRVVAGYKAEKISASGLPTILNERFAETNMVESLFCAIDFIKQEGDLLICYGDIVYQKENLKAVLGCADEVALMIDLDWRKLWSVRMDNPLEDAETLVMDSGGYVTGLGKQATAYDQIQGQYTGLIKIRSDKINDMLKFYEALDRGSDYDGQDFYNMYMTSFLQLLIDSGWKTKAVTVRGGWLEVDSLGDLETYEQLARKGELDEICKVSL